MRTILLHVLVTILRQGTEPLVTLFRGVKRHLEAPLFGRHCKVELRRGVPKQALIERRHDGRPRRMQVQRATNGSVGIAAPRNRGAVPLEEPVRLAKSQRASHPRAWPMSRHTHHPPHTHVFLKRCPILSAL